MDTLIISEENNILHVCNNGYYVNYTLYNSKGHNMDGGVLESSKGKFDNDFATKEILSIIKDTVTFSSPFIYLNGDKAENLLELIEMEDYKNMKQKVSEYSSHIDGEEIERINI